MWTCPSNLSLVEAAISGTEKFIRSQLSIDGSNTEYSGLMFLIRNKREINSSVDSGLFTNLRFRNRLEGFIVIFVNDPCELKKK